MLQTPNLLAGTANGHDSNPPEDQGQNRVGSIFEASKDTTKALLEQSGLDAKHITAQCRLIHLNIPPNLAIGGDNTTIGSEKLQENRLLERTIILVNCFRQITESAKNINPDNQINFIKKINTFLTLFNKKLSKEKVNELLEILLAGIKIRCTNKNWMILPGNNENTLAHLFASHGNISGLTFLEHHGVSTQQANFYMSKPIHLALHHQDSSVLAHLLKSYTDDTEDTGLPNLLDISILYNLSHSARFLCQHNFIPSPRSINKTTKFFGIVFSGYAEKIGRSGRENHTFWTQKVGVNCTQYFRNKYKIYTKLRKERYITKTFDEFLIEQNPYFFNNQRKTLHSNNIKKFAKDNFGRTPLHYAAMNPNPEVYTTVRTTLQAHPDLWTKLQAQVDNVGYTAQDYFLATHHNKPKTRHDPH